MTGATGPTGANRRRLPVVRPLVRLARVSWSDAARAAFPAAARPVIGDWGDSELRLLRQLWRDGMGTREIGQRLTRSKNSVIGKARRMGLEPRPSPLGVHPGQPLPAPRPRPQPSPPRPRLEPQQKCAMGRRPPAPPPPAPPQPPAAPSSDVRQCMWPTSDGRPWTFCGAACVPGRVYCLAHCRIAYHPRYRLEAAA